MAFCLAFQLTILSAYTVQYSDILPGLSSDILSGGRGSAVPARERRRRGEKSSYKSKSNLAGGEKEVLFK